MAKLKSLAPRLSSTSHRIAPLADNTLTESARDRTAAAPWRNWYKLKRWRDLRLEVLIEASFQCQRCGHIEDDTSKLVCDHKRPHRGDERLFWDRTNLQCLCSTCHDTAKQAEEQATLHHRGIWY